MHTNTDPTFVEIDGLKAEHAAQIDRFRAWAAAHQWNTFHRSHYDWWAFPIDLPSTHGVKYTVYAGDIEQLNTDPAFVTNHRDGLALVALSWGWDIHAAEELAEPEDYQSWQDWPVRLYKMAYSAKLFGRTDNFASLRTYAHILMQRGTVFRYGRHDLSAVFA
ncbi:MAG: hypothetical protein MUF38_15470 [Anaerolineae bacterium]|jgi:hypothetical protein|nr:hypothetical protein [Anaerolineae bacterium]